MTKARVEASSRPVGETDLPPACTLRWGMIADDLTGACDAGVQFAQCGFRAVVWLDPPNPRVHELTDLAILQIQSRNDSPEAARSKVIRACHFLSGVGAKLVFKKIDSTLRGNIGAEIGAGLKEGGSRWAVVAPAYPALGRTLEDGWLRVANSTDVSPTHLPTLLHEQGLAHVIHLPRSVLFDGIAGLVVSLKSVVHPPGEGPVTVTVDSASNEDLAVIAQAVRKIDPPPLVVGSAGLAAEVAKLLAVELGSEHAVHARAMPPKASSGAVVVVVGSTNRLTMRQVAHLTASRSAAVIPLRRGGIDVIRQGLQREQPFVVTIEVKQIDPELLLAFARAVSESSISGLVLSGGDTADFFCRALGASGIELRFEISPGIPVGRFIGGVLDGVGVVTKAGGFGEPDALQIATDFLAVPRDC